MKFPGRRKSRHYFPKEDKSRLRLDSDNSIANSIYVTGIDQLIVDIEAEVDEKYLEKYNIKKGESLVFDDAIVEKIYSELKENELILGEYAGGSIGNTLHNYSVLADNRSVAIGTIRNNITVGDYAFRYICSTNSHVDLSYLQPCDGPMARAMCLITPDKERSFVIGKGIMNDLDPEYLNTNVIENTSALLVSSYLFRDESSPICRSAMRAIEIAKSNNVPVVLSLGTSNIVEEKRDLIKKLLKDYVNIVASNEIEAQTLTGHEDPLLATEALLESVDMALVTVGPSGLYLGGFCDKSLLRKTGDMIHTKSIAQYNKYEYSRPMRREQCDEPVKVYTHINPYLGGPARVVSTNGAGDAALSAILHDIAANDYHRSVLPNSPKHIAKFLSYSSFHQISKYANRVSYEVLNQNSPRLRRGLPEKEDNLEEAYWAK